MIAYYPRGRLHFRFSASIVTSKAVVFSIIMDGKSYELSTEGFQPCQTDFSAIDLLCPHGCRIIGGNRKISDLFSIHGDQNMIVAPVGDVAKYLSRQCVAALPEDTEVCRRG